MTCLLTGTKWWAQWSLWLGDTGTIPKCKDDWLWSLFNSGIFRSYQNCVCGSFTDCCCNFEVPYLALSNPVPVCLNSRVMIGLSSFDGFLQSNSGANDKFSKSVRLYFWNFWGRCCCGVRLFDTRVKSQKFGITAAEQIIWGLRTRSCDFQLHRVLGRNYIAYTWPGTHSYICVLVAQWSYKVTSEIETTLNL